MSAANSHIHAHWWADIVRGFRSAFRDAKAVLTLNWKEYSRDEW